MPELLTGTVTFVFSDIEGSTRLLQTQGAGWPALLERHQQLLRDAFQAGGGVEVGTEGDSFFVAFPSASRAVSAAVAAQQSLAGESWPQGADIRVRIGMHTGEASIGTDGYVGLNVHRASRIASVANGGQVLLSDATHALLDSEPPDGVTLRDLGEHRLKDLERAEHLWQLVIPGIQDEFPPLRSLDAVPNNLPTALTTFLGREREIAEIGDLLGRSRLLTLTGPGGTGKTRLSLEVATRRLADYPDGVMVVELAPISEAELVPATIAMALGLPDRGGRPPVDRIIDHIGETKMLLVLDNFEQVVDAAPSIGQLLAACPRLTLLVSSRSALHVSGEQEYPVPPLAMPDPAHLPPLARLSEYEAVALFIERARSVKPDFDVTNENAPAVAEICVRLDGLPLAIELAAARIRILTPQAMLSRLEHRLGLLAGGSRDLPERQQTLRGAIAWSHDMLDETDRSLFACLSVFVGGAGFDAVERICGDEIATELFDALESLVEKSLVRQVDGVDGEPRFTMLETIREFAIEQAIARGRWDALRERHAALFLSLAEQAAAEVMGSQKRIWLDRVDEDHDNLRAAFSWAIESDRAETALRLGANLWRFWQMRGHLAEGRERLEQALAMPHGHDHPEARADALSAAAGLAYWQADADRSQELYEQEIAARRALGDRRGEAEAIYGLSFIWSIISRDAERSRIAAEKVQEALEIFRELDDASGVGRCEWALANIRWAAGDNEGARHHSLHALEVFEKIDDRFMVGWTTYTLGLASLSDDRDAPGGSAEARADARRQLTRAMAVFAEADDVSGYTLVLDAFAILALRDGDVERAARLAAVAGRLERTSGTGLNYWNREQLGFQPDRLANDPALADAWASGEAMTVTEAVAYAVGEPSPATPVPPGRAAGR